MLLHGGYISLGSKITNLRHGAARSLDAVSGYPVSTLHSHVNRFAEHKLGKEPSDKCVHSTIKINNCFISKALYWEV